jgi:hypothetical protein
VSHAESVRASGRPYRPRLNARKDAILIWEEIHQLVRAALAELLRQWLCAGQSGGRQGI